MLRVCFQTDKRVLLCTARSGQHWELAATAGSAGRWLSRVKTGLDKCKGNKWETKDWAGMYLPVPMDSSREAGEVQRGKHSGR